MSSSIFSPFVSLWQEGLATQVTLTTCVASLLTVAILFCYNLIIAQVHYFRFIGILMPVFGVCVASSIKRGFILLVNARHRAMAKSQTSWVPLAPAEFFLISAMVLAISSVYFK